MLILEAGGRLPDPVAIGQAADALRDGGVIAVPTDTVYGLAAVPGSPDALSRLFVLKERPASVPLPVLVGGPHQVPLVAAELEEAAARLAATHWPGPLTLVVPRSAAFTADLGGPPSSSSTVGIRWPAHPVMVELCAATGPLAVTSANRHGGTPARSAAEVGAAFDAPSTSQGPAVELVLDAGTCDGAPSTVVECRGPAVRCLRDGALPCADLEAELGARG
jgi:tRNA threonylcarbamoyl adenosine modification protein (Sua5/YciO/YrdC/YwlC family)